ncbi:MAG: PadR family transcriptional regulator [Anaerolineae bacterium]|jgi:DNA-binding PadR family transcriptional regulator|nr:PadR family transcriptional regulator [Anaerolineae bacterium]
MITDAELTILNLVAEGARYGHEIQELIDKRGLREWVTIGFSSVHYILNQLEERHLVVSELRSDGRGPARKIYALTEAGQGVLQTAISDRLRQPRPFGTGFELALANLNALKPAQVYHILNQHRADLRQRLLATEQSLQRQQKNAQTPEHIEALYSHSITLMEAELKWFDEFLKSWSRRYPAVLRNKPSDETNPLPSKDQTRHHVHEVAEEEKHLQKMKRPKDEPAEEPKDPDKRLQKIKRPKVSVQSADESETPTAIFPKEDTHGLSADDRKMDDSNDDF